MLGCGDTNLLEMVRSLLAAAFVIYSGIAGAHEHSDVRIFVIRSHLAQVAQGAVVFVGDSITESALLPSTVCGYPIINAGIGGATVASYREALYRIDKFNAAAIVVALGTNDAAGNISEFPATYRRLVQDLSSRSDLILMAGLPPIEHGKIAYLFDAAKAELLNSEISTIAASRFIDLRSELNSGHETIDGVHLSAEGYKPWMRAILSGIHAALRC